MTQGQILRLAQYLLFRQYCKAMGATEKLGDLALRLKSESTRQELPQIRRIMKNALDLVIKGVSRSNEGDL